ncbi:MAG: hypothetical protein LBP51_02655 [Deferribacteraceae bacterium]|jgi:hypothetical protein|nr:hypothetical protein [Deferribacteraceae bacterium]
MSDKHSSGSTGGSMEQVRDLLFGAQLKEMETANKKLEENLRREIESLKASLKGGLTSLESYVHSETSSLLEKINSENAAVANSIKSEQNKRESEFDIERKAVAENTEKLSNEIKNLQSAIEHKITALTGRFENVEKDLRRLIMSVNSELTELTEAKYNTLVATLNEVAAQIRHEDVSRAFISNIFLEMAMKLSDEAFKKVEQHIDEKGSKNEQTL